MSTIDLRPDFEAVLAPSDFAVGENLLWRGLRLEVVDVVPLVPGYTQVVLHYPNRKGLPLSVPASDLVDAVREA